MIPCPNHGIGDSVFHAFTGSLRKKAFHLMPHRFLLSMLLLVSLLGHASAKGADTTPPSSRPLPEEERIEEEIPYIEIPGMLFGGSDAHSRRNAPLPPLVPPPPTADAPSEQRMPTIPDTPIHVRIQEPRSGHAPSPDATPDSPSTPFPPRVPDPDPFRGLDPEIGEAVSQTPDSAPSPPLRDPEPARDAPSMGTPSRIPSAHRFPLPEMDKPAPSAHAGSDGMDAASSVSTTVPEAPSTPSRLSLPDAWPEPEFESDAPRPLRAEALIPTPPTDSPGESAPARETLSAHIDPSREAIDLPMPDIEETPRFTDVHASRQPAPDAPVTTRPDLPPADPPAASPDISSSGRAAFALPDLPDLPDTPGLHTLDRTGIRTPDSDKDPVPAEAPEAHRQTGEDSPPPDEIMAVEDLPAPPMPDYIDPRVFPEKPASQVPARPLPPVPLEMPEHEDMPSPWEDVPAPPTPPIPEPDPADKVPESLSAPPLPPDPHDPETRPPTEAERLTAALDQALEEAGLQISESGIEDALHAIRTEWEPHAPAGETWEAHLHARGHTPDSFREELRIAESLRALVLHTLDATEEDLRAYHALHPSRYASPEAVSLRWIRIDPALFAGEEASAVTSAHHEQAARLAERLYRSLVEEGHPFAAVASTHSHDLQTRSEGGLLGTVTRAQLPPELADTVFSLQPGLISPPILTQGGYVILRVESRIPARPLSYEETYRQVRRDFEEEMIRISVPVLRERFLQDTPAGE